MNGPPSKNPKVSIILPTYQRGHVVGRAVGDLLAQSLSNFELFVMDDGSVDNTANVIQAFDDLRLIYVRKEHLGIPGIVNAAWERCRGNYVIICHDHDRYHPDFLSELADLLDRHPSAAYAHCGIIEVDLTGNHQTTRYVRPYPELIRGEQFLTQCLLPGVDSVVPAITLVRSSMLGDRFLDPRFGGCADVELWMRLCLVGDAAYTPKTLLTLQQRDPDSAFYYRVHHLTQLVLNAKRLYLERVSNRVEIERGWRRIVDRTALGCALKARRDDRAELLPEIEAFVQREGTWVGIVSVNLLRATPAWLSSPLLRGMHSLRRGLQRPLSAAKP